MKGVAGVPMLLGGVEEDGATAESKVELSMQTGDTISKPIASL